MPAHYRFADRRCGTRIEAGNVLEGTGPIRPGNPELGNVQVGPVFFQGLQQKAHWRAPGVKSPVAIEAGVPVTVVVLPIGKTRVNLSYDPEVWQTDKDGQAAVRFHPCSPTTTLFSDRGTVGHRTWFNGGFTIDRPGCVWLIVHAHPSLKTVRKRAAIGVPPSRCQ